MPHNSARHGDRARPSRPRVGDPGEGAAAGGRRAQPRRRPSGRGRPAQATARRRPGPAGQPGPAARSRSALDEALEAALNVPAPADASFARLGLPGPLVDVLAGQGLTAPFAIQARALPDALAGRDLLGRAQTGSGKTLAFGLPLLARLAPAPAGPRRAPRGLVLVPTRELANQVAGVLTPLARALRLSVAAVYGGAPIARQASQLQRGTDVVVATPGRLIDLLDRGITTLSGIEITVLDEADHMADLGFMPAVTRLLDDTPPGGQRMLFSATLDRDVERLATRYLHGPAVHAVAPAAAAGRAADHQVFVLPAQDKLAVATEIAGRPGRTLFFVRTKHGAARLAKQLARGGAEAAAIHGNLNQNQRQRALDGFAAGRPRVLVATDVAARGLHIDDVDLVVHFDPPGDHKDYLHRSGRTARAGAAGTVLAFADPAQVREVTRLHDAAGVTATSHQVRPGSPAVRDIAVSGTPVPPPALSAGPPASRATSGPRPGPARGRSRRRGRPGPRGASRPAGLRQAS